MRKMIKEVDTEPEGPGNELAVFLDVPSEDRDINYWEVDWNDYDGGGIVTRKNQRKNIGENASWTLLTPD